MQKIGFQTKRTNETPAKNRNMPFDVVVRDWFVNLDNKQELTFVKFDVESFYPSISEELVRSAFEWAGTMVEINQEEKDVINKTKMSLLFVKGKPWVKRSSEWDITMGSFDGAEACLC